MHKTARLNSFVLLIFQFAVTGETRRELVSQLKGTQCGEELGGLALKALYADVAFSHTNSSCFIVFL